MGGSINAGLLAAAGAGVLIIGAGIGLEVAFGSVSATAANVAGMVDFGGLGGFDPSFLSLDGVNCDCCDAIPCAVRLLTEVSGALELKGLFMLLQPSGCGEECGECWGSHEGVLDLCFGNCGDSCGECGAAIGNCFGDCTNGLGDCAGGIYNVVCKCSPTVEPPSCCTGCGPCEGIFAGVSEIFGGISSALGGCLGGCAASCGDICNTVGDCASGCCGSYQDFCSDLSCDLGGACGCLGSAVEGLGGCAGGCVGGIGDCVGGGCGAVGDLVSMVGEGLSGAVSCVMDIFD